VQDWTSLGGALDRLRLPRKGRDYSYIGNSIIAHPAPSKEQLIKRKMQAPPPPKQISIARDPNLNRLISFGR
jgi:hypothetical protein